MNYFGFPVINPFRSHSRPEYDKVKGHTGIDIATPTGTVLDLPVRTVVRDIVKQNQMGLTLYLDHGKKTLVFAHLSKVIVKKGDELPPRTPFAYTGNSGTATSGPHLHFEVLGETPEPGLEIMVREKLAVEGFNHDPVKYLESIFAPAHWSDEEMAWAVKHKIISYPRSPEQPVTWGELVVVLYNLANRLIEWINESLKKP